MASAAPVGAKPAAATFFERLEAGVAAKDSLLCVGLDPHARDLPGGATADAAVSFCTRIVEATSAVAVAYKPNAAFFEALGADGVAALKTVIAAIPDNIPVLLDAKRGDISSTADAYASAGFTELGADAITVHPYMGADSVRPFSKFSPDGSAPTHGHGVFVLCKTSNPSSSELQALKLRDGRLVYEAVAEACLKWNADAGDNVGLVVGATDVDALARVRAICKEQWLLTPGVGAQGGDLDAALTAGLRADGSGMLVPVSRGISRAEDPRAAAEKLRDDINAVRRRRAGASAAAAAAGGSAGAGASASAGDGGALGGSTELAPYQRKFIETAMERGVLRFGTFTLKSGRESPYFFNAGLFNTGASEAALGATYAEAIVKSGIKFDVLFGPAYKGIPLVTAAGMALAQRGIDVPLAYNRKEAKDHGEGGVLVGASVESKRVLVLDDVISAGTAIGEAVSILRAAGATVSGVVIALDRQEKGKDGEDKAAVQQVTERFGVEVASIVRLADLIEYMSAASGGADASIAEALPRMREYRARWGTSE